MRTSVRLSFSAAAINIFPDTLGFLDQLRGLGVRRGLITAHPRESAEKYCKATGIADYFEYIVTDAESKVTAIKEFCEQYSLSPHNVWYVGDMNSDIRDAKAAGVRSIGIVRNHSIREQLEAAGADHCLETLHEVLGHIKMKP